MSFHLFERMGDDARQGPIKGRTFANCTHYGESSESLEGDRGRDRVRLCRLLTSFQEGLENDRGRDRVQRCHLFNVISRGSTPVVLYFSKFCK